MYLFRKVFKKLIIHLVPNLGSKQNNDPRCPRVVALVNWENLGDFVLFTAVIRETKLNYPDARLIVVAQKENKELANNCPYVEKWIWVRGHKKPKPGMGHGISTSYREKLLVSYALLLFHGRRKIDLLFGPDWLLVKSEQQFSSSFLFEKGNRNKEHLIAVASKNKSLFKEKSHQVTRMLSILKIFGQQVGSDELENWLDSNSLSNQFLFDLKQIGTSPRILVSLGAGQARRNWPIENVKQLIGALSTSFPKSQVIVLGPKSLVMKETNEAFPDSVNVRNLIGKTDLSLVASLTLNADLLVSNDSGLVHIASSLKLPCIVVSAHPLNGDPWHLHSPNRYHPWKTEYQVLQPRALLGDCLGSCQAASPHCITTISPIEVLEACKTLLSKKFS
jgi:ADP-heptose:LPS heptosyltransferase